MVEHAYIHIPFCIRKCKYCSFVSGENLKKKDIYLKALLKEIENRYKGEALKTLYFGGGTPSLLEADDIKKMISCFNFEKNAEITIEANPETVTFEKFRGFEQAGINRVSLGLQTFDDNILKLIGRGHDSFQSENAVKIIKSSGLSNISIDLIYGLPEQTIEMFEKDINIALGLDVNHISTYGLKIEKGSYFYENRFDNLPDDEIQVKMYKMLCSKLIDFEHYEISNFAKKGYESNHNCAYWENKEYYGFGLNASGYEKNIRYKNQAEFEKYIENPFKKEEEIELTKNETMENEIFLALRLKKGVNINEINEKYNIDFINKYKKITEKYSELGLLSLQNDVLSLTKEGILLSNEIMSEFIEV